VTSPVARSHSSRRRARSYSRALSIATPAAPANAWTTISSSSLNGAPVFFSVR